LAAAAVVGGGAAAVAQQARQAQIGVRAQALQQRCVGPSLKPFWGRLLFICVLRARHVPDAISCVFGVRACV
jgi:hypothetical protein